MTASNCMCAQGCDWTDSQHDALVQLQSCCCITLRAQDITDGRLEKQSRGVYGPPAGKHMAVFVDDLNMPQVGLHMQAAQDMHMAMLFELRRAEVCC